MEKPGIRVGLTFCLFMVLGCYKQGLSTLLWQELIALPLIRIIKARLYVCPPRMLLYSDENDIFDVYVRLLRRYDGWSAPVNTIHSIFRILKTEVGTHYFVQLTNRHKSLCDVLERFAYDIIDKFNRDAKDFPTQNWLLRQKTRLDMKQGAETLSQI